MPTTTAIRGADGATGTIADSAVIPLVLVPGTHAWGGSLGDTTRWWWPGDARSHPSPFVEEARRHGLLVLGTGDPFEWDTGLGGLWGRRRLLGWKAAGEHLRHYVLSWGITEVNVLAHSHGGAVAAFAARRRARGFRIRRLVTIGMPVRRDMTVIYALAFAPVGGRPGLERWVHLESDGDWWKILGRLGDWRFGRGRLPSKVLRVTVAGIGHSPFDPARWTAEGWWDEWFGEP